MSEEEIEYQLKKSRRQNKDERYEYINTHFNQTAYAMKLEKHAFKIHREKHQLQQRIDKAIDLVERLIEEYKLNYGDEPSKMLLAYETLLQTLKGQ